MMKKAGLFSLMVIFLLSGCVNVDIPQTTDIVETGESVLPTEMTAVEETVAPTEQPTETVTQTEDVWVSAVVGDGDATLTILERPLDTGVFAEDVLEDYVDEPWFSFKGLANRIVDGEDVYSFLMEEEPVEEGGENQTANWPDVVVRINDQPVASSPLGAASNMNPIWAFLVSDGNWYLEVFRGEAAIDENGKEWPVGGDILMNGDSLNELNGYAESFGLHLVSGKPFYFYVRDGVYGYVYNGIETTLDYTDISHYGCCSAGVANPRGSEDRVVIFASRGDQRFLVMIGDF